MPAGTKTRPNKATLEDPKLQDAFLEGVKEGVALSTSGTLVYVLECTFQGTKLRRVEFSDLEACVAEARAHLANGPQTMVSIEVVLVSNQSTTPPAIQDSPGADDDEVVEGEVVE